MGTYDTHKEAVFKDLLAACSYKWALSPNDLAYHFLGGKVRVSEEMLVDAWTYYQISPDFLIGLAEKHVDDVGKDEEIDFWISFENLSTTIREPLLTVHIQLFTVPTFSPWPTKCKQLLSEHYLETPNPTFFDNEVDCAKL